MNKVRILAVACLASIAFAGGDLWDFPNLLVKANEPFVAQVHTPGAILCWQNNPPTAANDYGKPCFDSTAGWWFGYAENGGSAKDAVSGKKVFQEASCESIVNPTPNQSEGTIAIEKYISSTQNDEWKSFTKETFSKEGHYLVKGFGIGDATDGLDINFTNDAGTDEDPSISAIGFNWREKGDCPGKEDMQHNNTEDISGKEGLCVVYKADKAGVAVTLGWNEAVYDYNEWVVELPAASDWKTYDMKWDRFAPTYQSPDDFHPLDIALTKAEAVKFAFSNKVASAASIHFQLKEVGWYGSCSGTASEPPPPENWWDGDSTPIVGGKMASIYRFSMNGRSLYANFAAGTVQVVNLQGKIVAKKSTCQRRVFEPRKRTCGRLYGSFQ